jgi:hypothetical protein
MVGGASQPSYPLHCRRFGAEGWLVGWLAALSVKNSKERSQQEKHKKQPTSQPSPLLPCCGLAFKGWLHRQPSANQPTFTAAQRWRGN